MDEFTQSLGTALKQYRKEHGYSQGYIAKVVLPEIEIKFSTAQTYVSRFERGKSVPDDVLFSIRKFVDVNVLKVAGDQQPTPPKKEPLISIEHTYVGKLPKEHEIAPFAIYADLVEWLFVNQGVYETGNNWRKALIAKLKESLKI